MSFDYIVERRNKTGRVVSTNPYTMRITKSITTIERKGIYYFPDGSVVPKEKLQELYPNKFPTTPIVAKVISRVVEVPKNVIHKLEENKSVDPQKGITKEAPDAYKK